MQLFWGSGCGTGQGQQQISIAFEIVASMVAELLVTDATTDL